jgi:FkbM family methyltransferase
MSIDMTDFIQRATRHWRRAVGRQHLTPAAAEKWEYSWKFEVIREILKVADGDFVDIGANIGRTLLDFYAAGGRGRYIGFEPNPASFVSLYSLVEENKFDKCLILPLGLSDRTMVVNLHSAIGIPTDGSASIMPDHRPTKRSMQTPVTCCRFDDLRAYLGLISIALMKIDVEGAELAVLHGMEKSLRELRTPILCEILYADMWADFSRYEHRVRSLIDFLSDKKYEIFRVRIHKENNTFHGLFKITQPPIAVWTAENGHECDYMLIPTERIDEYARLMIKFN